MPLVDKDQSIIFTSSIEQLSLLIKKIKDLTSIDQRIVMRIEPANILIFSFVGENFKNIHAFKSYIFPIIQVMNIKKGGIDEPIFFVSRDGKRLCRILENLLDYDQEIKCKISINEDNYVNLMTFENDKLNIKILGNDVVSIGAQISIEDVNFLYDTDKSLFNFRINHQDFTRIKRMGMVSSNEEKKTSPLYINVNNKILSIGEGETKWHLNVAQIEYEDTIMSFPKAYFNTINPTDFIDVFIFEEFILCRYDDFNLMILMETTI
jgi:hypothetical protein